MVPVAVALGSNLGDRRGHLTYAIDRLGDLLANPRVSSVLETAPLDVPDPQPPYLNAVVVGETDLGVEALVGALLAIELERGRTRRAWRAARTLDLDLILYGDVVLETAEVTVPHPRFAERLFVLEPLAEIAPDWIDPRTGMAIRDLAARASA